MFSRAIENIIVSKSTETYDFLRILRRELPDYIPSNLPLVSLRSNLNNRLYVYKNIKFDPTQVIRKIRLNADTFKPTFENLKNKLQYCTEVSYLQRGESVKLTTFLIRYLKLNNTTLKDNKIRDIVCSIMDSLYYDFTKVVYCKSVKDHVELYTKVHALSCMSPKNREYPEYNSDLKTFLHKEHNIWPSVWYYYNPHTQGVFLCVNGGRKVARTILIRTDVTKPFSIRSSGIYAESEFFSTKLMYMLDDLNFAVSYDCVAITKTFTVPAILLFKKPICPLPFHDCVSNYYSCYYNKEEKVFYFGPKTELPETAIVLGTPYCYCGYINSSMRPAHTSISRSELKC